MNYVAPDVTLDAFHCPFCGTYSHVEWSWLETSRQVTDYKLAKCVHCEESSMWRITEQSSTGYSVLATDGEMLFPDIGLAPLPDTDMPDDVKRDYQEAASIFSKSPRGAAALLRLGLQKLCKHLGQSGENINNDIRALAAENKLPLQVIKVADTVRITGNNAVHPGVMDDRDFDFVASKMFGLLNFIVRKGISEPKELDALYAMTPEGPRKAAEQRDEKSREEV